MQESTIQLSIHILCLNMFLILCWENQLVAFKTIVKCSCDELTSFDMKEGIVVFLLVYFHTNKIFSCVFHIIDKSLITRMV